MKPGDGWVMPVMLESGTYHLVFVAEETGKGFTVVCRELPGVVSEGVDATTAAANGLDALKTVLAFKEGMES